MIVYLTFGDTTSGIFRSQVEDLVLYLRKSQNVRIRLIAFISLRDFLANRKIIRSNVKDAIVLPMWPRLVNWRKNNLLLSFLLKRYKPDRIIARSVLATNIALNAREKGLVDQVVYDGRGAIAAEWKEYNVVTDEKLRSEIFNLEKKAVLKSDKQLAVSNRLVQYWKDEFGFAGSHYSVIPCTLGRAFLDFRLSREVIANTRRKFSFHENDVVLVYSGSTAGWQSMHKLIEFLSGLLQGQNNLKLLFLSKRTAVVDSLIDRFEGRVQQAFVRPEEVPEYLVAADYGLLIREVSVTNQVASPVKFAEYLACGLNVIISKGIGDHSELVEKSGLGFVTDKLPRVLDRESFEDKKRLRNMSLTKFTKENYSWIYLGL